MNALRYACRAALVVLTCFSAAALAHPAAPLDESSAPGARQAMAPSAATAPTSIKASQGAVKTSVDPHRSKNDLELTVLRSNLLVAPNGDECFNAIQTIDGR